MEELTFLRARDLLALTHLPYAFRSRRQNISRCQYLSSFARNDDEFQRESGFTCLLGRFHQAVRTEARQQMFKIRLWDQSDIVQAIYRTYDRLDPEIQAELPLKHIWTLVQEENETEE